MIWTKYEWKVLEKMFLRNWRGLSNLKWKEIYIWNHEVNELKSFYSVNVFS
jgi:hypothetical protein